MRRVLISLTLVLAGCEPEPFAPDHAAFRVANQKIESYQGLVGFGNSSKARDIAQRFAKLARTLRDEEFESSNPPRDTGPARGQFLTYCQLNADSACFLIRVPEFERYPPHSREFLLQLYWETARVVIGLELEPSARVAIGMRGANFYGALATGRLDGEPNTEVEHYAGSEILYPFFGG